MDKDPIKHAEELVRNIHDGAGRYTEPILKRYPLLFGFLIVFSVAAILHGFEIWSDEIELFHRHPGLLMLLGILTLVLTGRLYKEMERMK